MIPKGFHHYHFLKAIKEIDLDGVPKFRESYRYDLLIKGNKYPPKYVISIAYKYLKGGMWSPNNFNAVEAKDYFIRNGYRILDRKKNIKISKIQIEYSASKFPEGEEKYVQHRGLERDSRIGKNAKELRLDEVGVLRCDVCGFSFSDFYGEMGAGFIEAHHTVPVSQIKGKRKTKIEEIALVCSNCHRMLHSSAKVLSIVDLQFIIKEKQIKST